MPFVEIGDGWVVALASEKAMLAIRDLQKNNDGCLELAHGVKGVARDLEDEPIEWHR
jgi:hypothetical protein